MALPNGAATILTESQLNNDARLIWSKDSFKWNNVFGIVAMKLVVLGFISYFSFLLYQSYSTIIWCLSNFRG